MRKMLGELALWWWSLLGTAYAIKQDVIVSSFQEDDTLYDENNKLKSHMLVYPLEGQAPPGFTTPWYGFQHNALAGDAVKTVFPNHDPFNKDGEWVAACLERGTDRSVAGHTLPHKHYNSKVNTESFTSWFSNNCHHAELCLVNYYDKINPLQIHWVNSKTGQAQYQNDLVYGERSTKCFNSFLGHRFQVVAVVAKGDGETTEDVLEVIEEFTVEYTLVKAFGQSPPSGNIHGYKNLTREVEQTFRVEWSRKNKVKRTFSALGFAKGKLPPDVFASMGSLYYNNRYNKVNEEWGGKGFYVNWWESNVCFIQIPWQLKEIWQIRLANLVSEWAGEEVEQTVMYGLRQYENNARLLSHVDRTATHAVSLIVNIAQGNLIEPWPVEVFDHYGRLHEVLMQPGDIVYYESAKNLHSRNRPLTGRENAYYVNLFTHYRPVADGSNWYNVPTPENVPKPVLEVEGSCRLKYAGTSETADGQLGLVQKVHCDDPRLGQYISPTFFEVHSPQDLMTWWKRTAPDYKEDDEQVISSQKDEAAGIEQDTPSTATTMATAEESATPVANSSSNNRRASRPSTVTEKEEEVVAAHTTTATEDKGEL